MMDEGYVKFNCQWDRCDLLDQIAIDELIHWRNRLYDLGFIGAYPDGVGFGNISQRIDERRFIISGTQTGHIPILANKHFTIVEDFDLQNNKLWCRGPVRASSESMTHGAVYQQSDNIKVVIHIHNLEFWEKARDVLPTTAAEITYGTPEMALEIFRLFWETENMLKKKIIVMAGHKEGLIVFGENLEAAGNLLIKYARDFNVI